MIAGGTGEEQGTRSAAGLESDETILFRPDTDDWSYGKPLAASRMGHQSILLDDGRVLIVGGESHRGTQGARNFFGGKELTSSTGNWDPRPIPLVEVWTPDTAALGVVPNLLDGTQFAPYAETIYAVGGTRPYTFSVVGGSLPPGITLGAGGTFSGSTAVTGPFVFTVRVTDSAAQTADHTFTLFIAGI